MEQKKRKRWTKEEEDTLVQVVSASSYNLQKCFITVATKLDRTKQSVEKQWYKHTRFTPEGRKAILTIGKGSTYTGKNYCPGFKVKPTKKVRSASLWARLLIILRLK